MRGDAKAGSILAHLALLAQIGEFARSLTSLFVSLPITLTNGLDLHKGTNHVSKLTF